MLLFSLLSGTKLLGEEPSLVLVPLYVRTCMSPSIQSNKRLEAYSGVRTLRHISITCHSIMCDAMLSYSMQMEVKASNLGLLHAVLAATCGTGECNTRRARST